MENLSLEKSIITAMDGKDTRLIVHLPYILQDFWEIGSSTEEIIKIIKKYKSNYSSLNVLDLGSGKGAVSIKISLELGCKCFGVEGIDDFVVFSNNKTKEYNVNNICEFETNDIRRRIETLGRYDIIILGGIGPVFGNYYETLSKLKIHLNKGGLIIIDDAYIENDCLKNYTNIYKKDDIMEQIKNAGMELIELIAINEIHGIKEEYENEFEKIQKRCMELVEKYPKDKVIFLEYIKNQKDEYQNLSNEIIPSMFVINELGK
jgi:cyclopropane fatty-acyl-phospholipid synthase-like methyltransferase